MNKTLKFIVSLVFALSFTSFAQANADVVSFEAYGLNTIAGYNTYLHTSTSAPNTDIIFVVKKPGGEIVNVSAHTNADGVAQAELSDYYTSTAGTYSVSAVSQDGSAVGASNSFVVYPGEVSKSASIVSPTEQVVHNSGEVAYVTVLLSDNYKNPIEGHLVKLISSSNSDSIKSVSDSNLTDNGGKVSFKINSSKSGVATYTIYDSTADVILDYRAKVVYFDTFEYGLASAFGNSSSAINTFEFSDMPESIGINQPITFKLSAKDVNNQVVTGYTGTVKFSVASDNAFYADLPQDYTFTTQDLGAHTFSLALTFNKVGTYKVEARDKNTTTVFADYDFIVGGNAMAQQTGVAIQNPIAGTYSNNIQVISGTASAASKLKIFDNDAEIASIVSDIQGAFTYTTSALDNGIHKIYVAKVNDIGTIIETSPTIEINIDVSTPKITKVELLPGDTVDPGTVVTVKLFSDKNLSKAGLTFQDNVYDMDKSQDEDGHFETTFAAPIEFGQYKLSFQLKDQMGNDAVFENQTTLNVGAIFGPTQAKATVGDVTGLAATNSDTRVTLTWKAPASSTNPIQNYRVYYGQSPTQLIHAVDTLTASATWYVPNLKNGTEYYFAVAAMDNKGNISERFSNIVKSVPGASGSSIPVVTQTQPINVLDGSAGQDAITNMNSDVSKTGPEMLWLVLLSLLGGIFYVQSAKRRESNKNL